MNRADRRSTKAVKVSAKPRALEAIQADYAQTCAQAGELQFKMVNSQQSLAELNAKLIDLHAEAAEAQKLQDKAKEEAPSEPA